MNTVEISREEIAVGQEVIVHFMPEGYCGQGGSVTSFDSEVINLACPFHQQRIPWSDVHHIDIEQALPAEDCLEYSEFCDGPVDWHTTGSSFKAWPRCDYHAAQRQNRYEHSMERYADSDIAPEWFHPEDAGEHWDDD